MNRVEKEMMPTSKTGISSSGVALRRESGFTLLELIIVITILGIAALMVLPKFSAFGLNKGKSSTRHLAGLIQHLAQESVATKKTYRLYYDLEAEAYSVKILSGQEFIPISDVLISGRTLPKGMSFEDVVTPRHGKVQDGEAYTTFFNLGVEKTVIHLRDGQDIWTLMINGLTGRVKVIDRYVDQYERSPL